MPWEGAKFLRHFAAKNFFNTKDIVILRHNLSFVQCSWCENNIGFRLELSQVRPPEHSCFRHWLSIQPQRRLHGLLGLPICQGASPRLRIGQKKPTRCWTFPGQGGGYSMDLNFAMLVLPTLKSLQTATRQRAADSGWHNCWIALV